MKPTTLDIKRTGDLGGQSIAMGIDANAMGHIMNVLTDLYSNPKLAVIREYSTNARDAHIQAGIPDRPIEVTTPNQLSPYFTVRDFGPGLSVEDIEQIYSKYGASTKRGGNDQTGMLGLGCKSGLTYTSQFNVTAVKDGMKAVVTVFRLEDGTGTMNIVSHEPTDEPNSVLIEVPGKRGDNFLDTANAFFRFWEPGTVLLNGTKPKRIEGDEIAKGMIVVDGLDKDYVVMGGVAYPVNEPIAPSSSHYKSWGVVCYVGIGDINFTPSREDLHYTGRTKATLDTLRATFKSEAIKRVEKDVATSKTYFEAIEKYLRWEQRFGSQLLAGVKYKGLQVETEWQMPIHDLGTKDTWGRAETKQDLFISYSLGYGRGSVSKHNRSLRFQTLKEVLCVTNHPFDDLPSSRREKIKYYLTTKGLSHRTVLFFPGDIPGGKWTAEATKVDYSEVKALRPPRTQGGTKWATGYRFEVVDSNGQYKDTNELDTNLDIVYFSSADFDEYEMRKLFAPFVAKVQCVKLSRNRWDKFKRDFPTGQKITDWTKGQVAAAEAKLTEADKTHIWLDNTGKRSDFAKIDETKVKDPAIVKMVKAAKNKATTSAERTAYESAVKLTRRVLRQTPDDIKVADPLDTYPLVIFPGWKQEFHADNYLYMNAKFSQTSKPTPLTMPSRTAKV